MTDVLRVGVIGCGGIARGHIAGIQASPRMQLVATADNLPDRAQDYAHEFGAERWYASTDDLLADADVDAVHICLPNALHHAVTVQAAEAGKHVLVEKPMALSASDAEAMVAAADAAGVTLMIGQILRFRPANQEARRLVQAGRIGRPMNVMRRRVALLPPQRLNAWYGDTATHGNVSIYGTGSHEVDVVLWILDTEARRVFAAGRAVNPDWGCAEEVNSILELADGAIFNYVQSLNTHQGAWDCVIVGTEGSMLIASDAIDVNGQRVETPLPDGGGMPAQADEFASACLEGREPIASGRNVLRSMRALDAIQQSVDTGQVVEL